MMFSKLSIFVAATLVAFVAAAGPLPQDGSKSDNVPTNKGDNVSNKIDDGKAPTCPSGHVKCCTNMHKATNDDVKLGPKINADIPLQANVWVGCTDLVEGKTCPGPTVCCDKIASDGSIAIECTDPKA